MIKFLDLYNQYKTIQPEIDDAISRVIRNSSYIGGEEVENFEKQFSEYQNADYCIGVGNGTDAIEIALESLNLPENSEVIVPANSFIATSEAVTRQGLKVVFADVDSRSYTLDVDDVVRRITPRTRAIIAVHLYGHPCKMDELLEICDKYNLRIVEDCAQAHGAEFHDRRVGAIGDIGTFSFYPGKNLGAYGDGGAILTNDSELAKRCRMIANHGRIGKYNHEFEGRNSRLDGLQAAILSVKLRYLDKWIDRRNEIAQMYSDLLNGLSGVSLPSVSDKCRHAFHLYVIRTDSRNELAEYMKSQGISIGIHYPVCLSQLPAYKYLNQDGEDMFANYASHTLLSLPMGEHLSLDELNIIAKTIKCFFRES